MDTNAMLKFTRTAYELKKPKKASNAIKYLLGKHGADCEYSETYTFNYKLHSHIIMFIMGTATQKIP